MRVFDHLQDHVVDRDPALVERIGPELDALGIALAAEGVLIDFLDHGLVAKGGRVLAVTAVADSFANARARAYRAVDQTDFADGFHRRDIGWRELERAGA